MITNMNERKKIFLIDDDVAYLTIAELFLKNEYDIYKATSGGDALKYLCSNKFTPNLIMLDILMPNMDGWEVFNKIRAIGVLKNVPIVFLTTAEEEKEKKKVRKFGAAGYITKPYNMVDLRCRIRDILKDQENRRGAVSKPFAAHGRVFFPPPFRSGPAGLRYPPNGN